MAFRGKEEITFCRKFYSQMAMKSKFLLIFIFLEKMRLNQDYQASIVRIEVSAYVAALSLISCNKRTI